MSLVLHGATLRLNATSLRIGYSATIIADINIDKIHNYTKEIVII